MRGIQRAILILVPAIMAGPVLPARADLAADLPYCISAKNEYPLDKVMEACSNVIASGKYSGGELARAYDMRATVNKIQKHTDQAIADYSEAIRLFPKFWSAFRDRGQMYIAQHNYQQAADDLDIYVSHTTDDWKGFYFRGVAHYGLNQPAIVIESMTSGLALQPDYPEMLRVRGEAYANTGRYDQAEADYAAVRRVAPDDSNLPGDLAALAQARKTYADKVAVQAAADNKAQAAFQAKLKKANAGELFVMANDAQKNGDAAGAEAARNALLTRFPNSPLAAMAAQQMAGISSGASAAPARTATRSTGGGSSGGGSGASCTSVLYELADVINKSQAGTETGSYSAHDLWAQHQFQRLMEMVPACRSDAAMQANVRDTIQKDMASCRQDSSNPQDCVNGSYLGGKSGGNQGAVEAALQRIAAANQGSGPARPASAAGGSCKEQLDRHAKVIDAATSRQNTSKGSKMIFVHAMWMASSTMQVLDQYCKGQPEYGMYAGLKQQLSQAKTSCVQLSSDNGQTCVPTKVW